MMRRHSIGLCALLLMGAACSATSDDRAAVQADESEPLVLAQPTTTEPDAEVRWLESVVSKEPSANGWSLDAGRWTTTAFRTPVSFELPEGLALVDLEDAKISIAADGDSTSRSRIVIARSSAMTHADGRQQPVPETPADITAFIEGQETMTILDQGLIAGLDGAEFGWWDLVLDGIDSPFACSLGTRCASISVTSGGGSVDVLMGEPFRVLSIKAGDVRFGIYVVGVEPGLEQLREVAAMIATSVRLPAEVDPPRQSTVFIGSLGPRAQQLDAGHYRKLLGHGVVDLTIDDAVDSVRLTHSDERSAGFSSPSGFGALLGLNDGSLVAPGADQSTFAESTGSLEADDFLAESPRTVEEFRAWASELFEVTAEGSTVIDGADIPWFEFGLVDGQSFDCPTGYGPPLADQCAAFHPGWWHSDAELENRHYLFAEAGVLLVIGAEGGATIDEALAEFQPMLDGLRVTALD